MTTVPLLLAGALYLWTAVGFFVKGKYFFSLAFICYAIANLGFALETK